MARRTIGKLAKEAGVGVETVRFYERRGILNQPPKPARGYRSYSERDLVTIKYVKEAQGLSFSLDEVQSLFTKAEGEAKGFCSAVRGVARKKLATVQKEIAELRKLEAKLQKFLVDCAANKGEKNCPILRQIRACPKPC